MWRLNMAISYSSDEYIFSLWIKVFIKLVWELSPKDSGFSAEKSTGS